MVIVVMGHKIGLKRCGMSDAVGIPFYFEGLETTSRKLIQYRDIGKFCSQRFVRIVEGFFVFKGTVDQGNLAEVLGIALTPGQAIVERVVVVIDINGTAPVLIKALSGGSAIQPIRS